MTKEKKVSMDEKTKSENFKNAICYIPFLAIVLFFTDIKKNAEFEKNIRYGIYLLICLIIIFLILGIIPFLSSLVGIAWFVYIIVSIFFGWKAYKWDDIKIDFFDSIEAKINDKK